MSRITKLYENYYKEQTPESIDELFVELVHYDYSNYKDDIEEIARMHRRTICQGEGRAMLRTNGSSSGSRRDYEFAPHFYHWASKIEPFLRNMWAGKSIFLFSGIGYGALPKKFYISNVENNKKDYETNGNFLDEDQLRELFLFVNRIYEEHGRVNLSSFPHIWNVLLSNPVFNQMCLENKDKIWSLVNSDYDMLFSTKELYVRDQMINWVSGVNFFTCEHGFKHFLPTFYVGHKGCVSLINMYGENDDSDHVVLGEVRSCECGRNSVPMDIIFHKENAVLGSDGNVLDFSGLANSLKGHYANFQIHQNEENVISVLMNPVRDLILDDIEAINSFFLDMKIKIMTDKYYHIGSKRYCFWRSKSLDAKDFKLEDQYATIFHI